MIEQAVEGVLEVILPDPSSPLASGPPSGENSPDHSPSAQQNGTSVSSFCEDDIRDFVVVAFHSYVTAGVGGLLRRHWRAVHEAEDYAFLHACGSLCRTVSVSTCLIDAGITLKDPADEHSLSFHKAQKLIAVLESEVHSVFGTLQLMEAIVNSIVQVLSSVVKDVTADACIPFLVLVLATSKPAALPSQVKLLYNFMLGIYESTSLCYALTTFEAACAQLLHEYSSSVFLSVDDTVGNCHSETLGAHIPGQ